jgi:hypothetical protein
VEGLQFGLYGMKHLAASHIPPPNLHLGRCGHVLEEARLSPKAMAHVETNGHQKIPTILSAGRIFGMTLVHAQRGYQNHRADRAGRHKIAQDDDDSRARLFTSALCK